MTNKKQPTEPNDYSVRHNHFSQPFKLSRFVFLTINLVMYREQQKAKPNKRENPVFKTKCRAADIYLFSKHLSRAFCGAWDGKERGWTLRSGPPPGELLSVEEKRTLGVSVCP